MIPASTFVHRSPLRLWGEKYIFMVFLEMIQMKNVFFFSATAVTGSALAVSRAHRAIVRSASCSAMTTPNSRCDVALSWWMKLDLLAGLAKNLSLSVSHLCCGCTSRCVNVYWYSLSDAMLRTRPFLEKLSVTALPSMLWRMASLSACVLSALTHEDTVLALALLCRVFAQKSTCCKGLCYSMLLVTFIKPSLSQVSFGRHAKWC